MNLDLIGLDLLIPGKFIIDLEGLQLYSNQLRWLL